jgi:hypothetical protein
LRRPSPRKFSPELRLGRLLLASLLACAVGAGAAPLGLVADAGGCSMPCCQGAGGDCADGSCPVGELHQPEAPTPAAAASDESDPMCGADAAATQVAGDAAHGGHDAAHAHAAPTPKPQALPAGEVRIEHTHRRHVSPRNTLPGVPSVAAVVSKPCPPDCGAATNSHTNPRPSRGHAALAHRLRQRPPAHASQARSEAFSARTSSGRRGPCSPRGPPADAAVSLA